MKPSEKAGWKRTHIANRLMVWITAIVALATVCLAVAAVFQYLTAREQSKAAREQAEAARKSVNIAADQSQAVKDSAQAAKDSAASASTLTEQNKELIGAAKTQANASMSQANTSKTSARAAEESARIARQVYEAGQIPQIYFESSVLKKFTVGEEPVVQIVIRNTGKKALNFRIESGFVTTPQPFEKVLPDYNLRPDKTPASLEQNEPITITFHLEFKPIDDLIKALDRESHLLIIYGRAYYEDSLGRPYFFGFCRLYNKEIFPTLAICPETIKVPEPKAR